MGYSPTMTARRISCPADIEQVVSVADCYASEAMDLYALLEGEDLHKALAGSYLLFLTDIASTEVAA